MPTITFTDGPAAGGSCVVDDPPARISVLGDGEHPLRPVIVAHDAAGAVRYRREDHRPDDGQPVAYRLDSFDVREDRYGDPAHEDCPECGPVCDGGVS
jgi:hypothetical protein